MLVKKLNMQFTVWTFRGVMLSNQMWHDSIYSAAVLHSNDGQCIFLYIQIWLGNHLAHWLTSWLCFYVDVAALFVTLMSKNISFKQCQLA